MKLRFAAALAVASSFCLTPSTQAQDASGDGERLFRARCASCHGIEPGQNRIGPNLSGVVGREAAAVEGARYSAALRASHVVWNAETLDAYLANPRQVVPGTTMVFSLRDAAQRSAIIAHLRGLPGPGAGR